MCVYEHRTFDFVSCLLEFAKFCNLHVPISPPDTTKFWIVVYFCHFNKNRVESDWKNCEDIDTFHIKIINFSIGITKIQKKFRLAAGPLPGVALSGEQPPAARCAGAKMRENLSKFWVFLFPFLDDLAPL